MPSSSHYHWNNSLNGISAGQNNIVTTNSNSSAWSLASNVSSEAITIRNKDGENVLTFHNDGTVETAGGKIRADEWIQITLLMKQFFMDVAKDEEFAKKYPYVRDMAHGWVMNELRK